MNNSSSEINELDDTNDKIKINYLNKNIFNYLNKNIFNFLNESINECLICYCILNYNKISIHNCRCKCFNVVLVCEKCFLCWFISNNKCFICRESFINDNNMFKNYKFYDTLLYIKTKNEIKKKTLQILPLQLDRSVVNNNQLFENSMNVSIVNMPNDDIPSNIISTELPHNNVNTFNIILNGFICLCFSICGSLILYMLVKNNN